MPPTLTRPLAEADTATLAPRRIALHAEEVEEIEDELAHDLDLLTPLPRPG